MNNDTIQAIPTVFNGIEYRSRLEADTARLLTMLEIPFEYEKVSYLLPSGLHFWPDFSLHGGRQVLEVRGYRSARADRQLQEFADFVGAGRAGHWCLFAVLSEDEIVPVIDAVNEAIWSGVVRSPSWMFQRCPECKAWNIRASGYGFSHVNSCCRWFEPDSSLKVVVVDGVLSVWDYDEHEGEFTTAVRDFATLADLLGEGA